MTEAGNDQAMVRGLEEASINGLPALTTEYYDGWLVRRSEGYSRRANCVMSMYKSRMPLIEKVSHCEAYYSKHALPCIFKLTHQSLPAELDRELEGRGYDRDAETVVVTKSIREVNEPTANVELFDDPGDLWIQTWASLSDRGKQSSVLLRLLRSIPTPAKYAVVREGSLGIACARAVISSDSVWLYDLIVAPDYRGKGIGTSLVQARLGWAYREGINTAFLQVEARNERATRLHAGVGFSEVYRYWYRTKVIG